MIAVSGGTMTWAFGEMEHGWFDVEIRMNDEPVFCDSISYTPNDGLRDLLVAMRVMLSSPGAVGRCDWSNEPGFFALFLENRTPDFHFSMRLVPEYFHEPNEKDEVWCECTGQLTDFARAFHDAFQALITQYDAQEYERRWKHPFPLKEWQELLPLLRAAR